MTQAPENQSAVQRMWLDFRQATLTEAELVSVFAFGDSPAMADQLALLVLHGPKRATAALRLEFERDGEAVPVRGDHAIVLDGEGRPVCVIRTTDVQIKPLNLVDAEFAWDEGEGDRSLTYWQQAHRRYFSRQCQQIGVPFDEGLPVVLERFEVVWPPQDSVADPDR